MIRRLRKNANKRSIRTINYFDIMTSVEANEGLHISWSIIISITIYMVYFLIFYIYIFYVYVHIYYSIYGLFLNFYFLYIFLLEFCWVCKNFVSVNKIIYIVKYFKFHYYKIIFVPQFTITLYWYYYLLFCIL